MQSADKIRAEFDQVALRLDEQQKKDFSWEARHYALIHDLLDRMPTPCRAALDVGCGLGAVTSQLAERAEHVLAIDISPEMIRVAHERFRDQPAVEFQVADLLAWEIPLEGFDWIVSKTALHHMPLGAGLEKMKVGLRAGGALLVIDKYEPEHKAGRAGPLVAAVKRLVKRFGRRLLRARPAHKEMKWGHDPGETYMSLSEVYRVCHEVVPGAEIRIHEHKHLCSILWFRP
jgi:ubiquinone/menaquinone biosynthesis C-methylase UbiE